MKLRCSKILTAQLVVKSLREVVKQLMDSPARSARYSAIWTPQVADFQPPIS